MISKAGYTELLTVPRRNASRAVSVERMRMHRTHFKKAEARCMYSAITKANYSVRKVPVPLKRDFRFPNPVALIGTGWS